MTAPSREPTEAMRKKAALLADSRISIWDDDTDAGWIERIARALAEQDTAARREGFAAGLERAAREHENVNPASDEERSHGIPGADAMGAVIEYRDRIRALEPGEGTT